ncbi:MAG: class I SAM-dependent methyltransferase [Candidatus Methanomethyliaceae archaeon]
MSKDELKDIEAIRERWDERARRYDAYYETFKGAVEHYVDWELLKTHLPQDKRARILDATGGTGRITLPLAKMGYSVTLCDISPRMLEVAGQKLLAAGVLDRVEILECDVRKLRFPDESFDFVLCWNGSSEAVKELMRVTKRGGRISVFLVNRCRGAIDRFSEDPESALALIESRLDYLYDEGLRYRAVSPEEAREWFEAEGIRVLSVYAVCGWLDLLCIPQELREAGEWDESFFRWTTEMVLRLSQEPSVQGMSRHLVLYGEKI